MLKIIDYKAARWAAFLYGAVPHTPFLWGYAPHTRRTGLCSPNRLVYIGMVGESRFCEILERQNTKVRYLLALTVAYFLMKNSAKDSLGEVSPKTPLLPDRLPKNRTPVRFLSDRTHSQVSLKTKTVTCHRCS